MSSVPTIHLPSYVALARHWPAGESVGLACSGGVDSSAMLALAAHACSRGEIPGFVALHVDHRTRPETADEGDAVAALCRRFNVPLERLQIERPEDTRGRSPEELLRESRYDALALGARRLGIGVVATAHTRDDQIETVLMRLLTGSGGIASAGMRPLTTLQTAHGGLEIWRPLLMIGRDELMDVLGRFQIVAIEDPSNLETRFRRNALRHEIVPVLRERVPGFERALLRSVSLAARDADLADNLAMEAYENVARPRNDGIDVNRDWILATHRAITTRVVRMAAGNLMSGDMRELTRERIESVLRAAAGRTGAVVELPGAVVVRIERNVVRLERREKHG